MASTVPPVNTGIRKDIPPAWAPLINDYLLSQAAAGRPRTTLGTRRSHLARMARELECQPDEVTGDTLERWFGRQRNWQIETRRSYRNTLRSFFGWAHSRGHLPTNPSTALPKVKARKPAPRPTPEPVWSAALNAAEGLADGRVAIMLRLASHGLRRGEVAQVHTDDLTPGGGGWLLRVHGKGDKVRTIPISDETAALVARGPHAHSPWLARAGWLFPGADGGHLSARWVGRLCARIMPDVWTMHSLRHRCATRAYRGTRNLRAVQQLLGHESVATTEAYTFVDDDEVRSAMMAAVA